MSRVHGDIEHAHHPTNPIYLGLGDSEYQDQNLLPDDIPTESSSQLQHRGARSHTIDGFYATKTTDSSESHTHQSIRE